MNQLHVFRTTRRVEFSDTDAAGIMHFSAFFRLMEQAEHELLRTVGLSVMMTDAGGKFSWPRASAKCDYRSAAKFEDVLDIEVRIPRLGGKSITYAFRFTRTDDGKTSEIATGEITAVCCRVTPDGSLQSISVPKVFRENLNRFICPHPPA